MDPRNGIDNSDPSIGHEDVFRLQISEEIEVAELCFGK